jgi:hypothetical protein
MHDEVVNNDARWQIVIFVIFEFTGPKNEVYQGTQLAVPTVLSTKNMSMVVSWVVTPCGLVGGYSEEYNGSIFRVSKLYKFPDRWTGRRALFLKPSLPLD